jgi:folate-binding protein YgfZ
MPDISDPLELYHRATTDVAAFNLSAFGKLVLRGKDAATFLQNFTTNDVVKPGQGSGCETFVLTAQAKIVAWARVAIGDNELYLHTEPGAVLRLLQHLEKHQIGEDVTFEDVTEVNALWHVCGPRLAEHLRPIGIELHNLSQWQHVEHEWLSRAQRCDFLGMPGVFFFLQQSSAMDGLLHWCTGNQIPLAWPRDPLWTMLRTEAGTPAFGIDFDETNLPQEVNRTEEAISFTKGCYLGQETVARIRAYGHVNKQLVAVKFPSRTELNWSEITAWQGAALHKDGKEVGKVKTVSYSPLRGCWLAFAMIRREHLALGTQLDAVHAERGRTPVEVTGWPRTGTKTASSSH